MAYTTHLVHIPGSPRPFTVPKPTCAGIWACLPCMREARDWYKAYRPELLKPKVEKRNAEAPEVHP